MTAGIINAGTGLLSLAAPKVDMLGKGIKVNAEQSKSMSIISGGEYMADQMSASGQIPGKYERIKRR